MTRLANIEKAGYYPLPPTITDLILTYITPPVNGHLADGHSQDGSSANGRLVNGRSTNGRLPNDRSTNGRPVTRKTTAVAARKPVQSAVAVNGVSVGKNGTSSTAPLPRLLYGDGLLVSMENTAERSAYVSYRQVHGSVPPSRTALQTFYQQQA